MNFRLYFIFIILISSFNCQSLYGPPFTVELSKGHTNPNLVAISPSGKYLIQWKKDFGFKLTDNDNSDFVRYFTCFDEPEQLFFNSDETSFVYRVKDKSFIYYVIENKLVTLPSPVDLFPSPHTDSLLVFEKPYSVYLISTKTLEKGRKRILQQKIEQITTSGNGTHWAFVVGNSLLYGTLLSVTDLNQISVPEKVHNLSYSYYGYYLSFATSKKVYLIDAQTGDVFEQDVPNKEKLHHTQTFDDAVTNYISITNDNRYKSELLFWSGKNHNTKTVQVLQNPFHSFTKSRFLQVYVDEKASAYWAHHTSPQQKHPLFFPGDIFGVQLSDSGLWIQTSSTSFFQNSKTKQIESGKKVFPTHLKTGSKTSTIIDMQTYKPLFFEQFGTRVINVISISPNREIWMTESGDLYQFSFSAKELRPEIKFLMNQLDLVSVIPYAIHWLLLRVNGQIDVIKADTPEQVLGHIFFYKNSYLAISEDNQYEGDASLFELLYVTDDKGKRIKTFTGTKVNDLISKWFK